MSGAIERKAAIMAMAAVTERALSDKRAGAEFNQGDYNGLHPGSAQLRAFADTLDRSPRVAAIAQLQTALSQSPRVGRLSDIGRRLSARSATPPAVAQFAKLNIRKAATKDGAGADTISGVTNFPARPASNLRGTQGQHLTAYVAFEEMIISHVADRTPTEAAAELDRVLQSFDQLPGMASAQTYLTDAIRNVRVYLARANGDTNNDKFIVERAIDQILIIRNQVPDTAVRGKGGGHGEARPAGILEEAEKKWRSAGRTGIAPAWKDSSGDDMTDDAMAEECVIAMWQLLDLDPPTGQAQSAFETTIRRTRSHIAQMSLSFPLVMEWLSTNQDWFLLRYLRFNRTTTHGMPLAQLSDAEIDAICDEIEGGHW